MLKPLLPLNFGNVPVYYIMLAVAFLAGLFTLNHSLKKFQFSYFMRKRVRKSFFVGTLFGLAGANIINWFLYENGMSGSLYQRFTQGGYSFYFGLFFFFAASAVTLRLYKVDVKYCLNLIIPSVLIAQFFVRIGCSLSGCCWGRDITLFGFTFSFPVRELEAVFAIVLFIVLSKRAFFKRFSIYVFSYSLFRFVTEFMRGDDRGSLFGITALSPTQIVSSVVTVIAGALLFVRPICRLFGAEQGLDNFKNSIVKIFKPAPKQGKAPYEPYPYYYAPAVIKKSPLKIVITIVAAVTAACFVFVYVNPFNAAWCDDIRYTLDNTFGSVFAPGGEENEIGDTNGVSLLSISEKGIIKDAGTALSVVSSYDSWTDFDFDKGTLKNLANGNHLYVFNQVFKDKPILGKMRALLTDKDNKALYMVGDAAELTYTNEILSSFVSSAPAFASVFGANAAVKSKTDCWYDTGDGLIAATHIILANGSKNAALGAVVEAGSNRIICLTPPEEGVLPTAESNAVKGAIETVEPLIKADNTAKIEEILDAEDTESALEEDRQSVEKAICQAYEDSDISAKSFLIALESAKEIINGTPGANKNIFREVLAEEVKQTLINDGEKEKVADNCREDVIDAFEDQDIDCTKDETATDITAETGKTSFKHSIDYKSDVDVFSLKGQENHTTELTFSTETPIAVEVSDTAGRAVLSMYVDDEETVSLYPEDGSEFVVKVSGQNTSLSAVKGSSNYKMGVKAISEEDNIPTGVKSTLSRVNDYYERSNVSGLVSMCAIDGNSALMEEAIALGALSSMSDSCAGCVGMDAGMDTGKTLIATLLIPNAEQMTDLQFLGGSEMELTYFHHIENEKGIALKARIVITIDGVELYNGFTFMQLTSANNIIDTSAIDTGDAELDGLMSGLLGTAASEGYYITDINSSALYSAFGDTPGNIKTTNDLTSLYELWDEQSEKINGGRFDLKSFDEQEALRRGHSKEKVQAFKAYTARHNLLTVKQYRAMLITEKAVLDGVSDIGEPAKMVYDCISNPLFFAGDMAFKDNETANTVWTAAKAMVDLDGVITDAVCAEIFSAADSESERIEKEIALVDAVVSILDKRYQDLKAEN